MLNSFPAPNGSELGRDLAEWTGRNNRPSELQIGSVRFDQVLDVKQQARFRVFEQQMEQRLLQLVARARQTNRAKQPKQ